ncbi:DUF2238 domain-containing protein [soil metagenome]
MSAQRRLWLCIALMLAGLLVSGWHPYERGTWWMEVFPAIVVMVLMIATAKRYPLSDLLLVLIVIHATILMVGGAYTYARVPFGFTVADWFGWQRNPYDKLGHFAQGFVPAVAIREILIRGDHVRGRRMLGLVIICIALAISAGYELVEWGAAVALGAGADDFLGTQGDPFDTQSDMLMALIGAAAALMTMPRLHDKSLARLPLYE